MKKILTATILVSIGVLIGRQVATFSQSRTLAQAPARSAAQNSGEPKAPVAEGYILNATPRWLNPAPPRTKARDVRPDTASSRMPPDSNRSSKTRPAPRRGHRLSPAERGRGLLHPQRRRRDADERQGISGQTWRRDPNPPRQFARVEADRQR